MNESGRLDGNNPASTSIRQARAQVRADLRAGRIRVADVLADPPACILDVTLHDVLRWQVATRSPRRDMRLGSEALADRVNLLVPVGLASARSKAWAAQHGDFYLARRRKAKS